MKKHQDIPPRLIRQWVENNFEYNARKGKNGTELVIANPFYHNDNKKMNISLEKGIVHDWRGDDWAGPVSEKTGKRNCSFINFVRLYRKSSFRDAMKEVMGSSFVPYRGGNIEIATNDGKSKEEQEITLPDGASLLYSDENKVAKILKKWLKSRGYTEEDIEYHNIYYNGMDVYWPYFEYGELVYWQSRSMVNKFFRFPELTEYGKGDFLYGFDDVKTSDYIILTEAIFDKHTLREQALATGGATLTARQIKKLKILGPKYVILSPDNDSAGLKSIIYNKDILQKYGFTEIFYSIPPKEYKDWNELAMNGVGFDSVREVHDEYINKLDISGVANINNIIKNLS